MHVVRTDRSRNEGTSFIEILIAVALLGLAVVGTMPALWASVHGSGLQDRFAGARRWVVSAGDYAVTPALTRRPCYNTTTASIITNYQTDLRTAVATDQPPAPWVSTELTVTGVTFWNGTKFTSACSETATLPLTMQQISLKVISPDGNVVETLDVVKNA